MLEAGWADCWPQGAGVVSLSWIRGSNCFHLTDLPFLSSLSVSLPFLCVPHASPTWPLSNPFHAVPSSAPRFIDAATVRRALQMPRLIGQMRTALGDLAAGRVQQVSR